MDIRNNAFLVTGGSSGLGAATVRMLTSGGAKVIIADVNRHAGEALTAELGARVRFSSTDVTSEAEVEAAIDASMEGGVVGMTLPLAREFARFGIRIMTIAPGVFETPMGSEVSEAVHASLVRLALFPPRLGSPGEFAALVRHVIENVMLNGSVIRIDGLVRLPPK